MYLVRHLSADFPPMRPCAFTLGTFDGVHRGHAYLFAQLFRIAKERNLASALLTFSNHPSELLRPESPARKLTSDAQKIALLEPFGFDLVCNIEFTEAIRSLEAEPFLRLLFERIPIAHIVVGPDLAFGKNRQGTSAFLRAHAEALGYSVIVVEPLIDGNERISSSAIRRLVRDGRIEQAADLLGRPYSLWAERVYRQKNSLRLDVSELVIPRPGVYSISIAPVGSKEWTCGQAEVYTDGEFRVELPDTCFLPEGDAFEVRFEVM